MNVYLGYIVVNTRAILSHTFLCITSLLQPKANLYLCDPLWLGFYTYKHSFCSSCIRFFLLTDLQTCWVACIKKKEHSMSVIIFLLKPNRFYTHYSTAVTPSVFYVHLLPLFPVECFVFRKKQYLKIFFFPRLLFFF